MCLLTFRLAQHPDYKLVLAANRDEKYLRPAQAAHFWDDPKGLLAGKDLEANGTWLGIDRNGKIAALTNCLQLPDDPPEELHDRASNKRSRGELVIGYFRSGRSPVEFIKQMQASREEYEAFNLLFGTVDQIYHYNSREDDLQLISPGTHSLSNASLDTPWPKTRKTLAKLDAILEEETDYIDELFQMMQDQTPAPDSELPPSPLPLAEKRAVTAPFIVTDHFGTRNTTILLVSKTNEVHFIERTYFSSKESRDEHFHFHLQEDRPTTGNLL